MPESIKEFERGFGDGIGEGGAAGHLSDGERAKGEEMQKKWAFNKVGSTGWPLAFPQLVPSDGQETEL